MTRTWTPRLRGAGHATLALVALALVSSCSAGEDAPATGTAQGATVAPRADSGPASLATAGDGSGRGEITCTPARRTPAAPAGSWHHPGQSFYTGAEPDLPGPADLEHLLRADGAAVVRYSPKALPDASVAALRSWAENAVAVVALPADRRTTDPSTPVVVETLREQLHCDGLDTIQLDAFITERDLGDVEAH